MCARTSPLRGALLTLSLTLSLSLVCLSCGGSGATSSVVSVVPRYTYQVIATYPHDASLFTQGLAVNEQGELIESGGGYGESVALIRSLEDVAPRHAHSLSSERFGEGITSVGPLVLQLTWQAREALLYRGEDLSPLGVLSYQTQGWGLAHGPHGTVYSDGSSELRWVSHPALSEAISRSAVPSEPLSGRLEVTRSQTIREAGRPIAQLNELEWVGRLMVANVWRRDELVVIDPERGEVIARIDLTGLLSPDLRPDGFDPLNDVLNGVAWLPSSPASHALTDLSALTSTHGRLLVTGKRWPLVYELRLSLISPKSEQADTEFIQP